MISFQRLAVLIFALAGFGVNLLADNQLPRVFYADPNALAGAKAKLAAGDTSFKPALNRLLEDANSALEVTPQTVVDKKHVPPSGDKHDYMSQAPYYWLDTNSPSPKYIQRDGERNPESEKDSDANRLNATCSALTTLGLAYYFTGNEKYPAKAAQLIRVFFLDPATKMNPNLNFGQGIPGQVNGRPFGLISARCFVPMMDSLSLLEKSPSWPVSDQHAMHIWLQQYLHWMMTSKLGKAELAGKNNHGSFCTGQAAAIAMYLGKTDVARALVAGAKKRIGWQIKPDGRQPLELARTKSFGYSSFNLNALMDLAAIGQNLQIDLWHYQAPDGGSICQALTFMAPYANPKLKWPFQQIQGYNHDDLADLLLRAAPQFPQSPFAADLNFFNANDLISSRSQLLFQTAPISMTANFDKKAGGANAAHETSEQ